VLGSELSGTDSKLSTQHSEPRSPILPRSRLAVPRFPSLGSPVLIEIHAIAHALRAPCQELVVPHLASGGKFLEALGVAEFTYQFILLDLTDTGFECIYSGLAAG
jgi:hypothetical protein